MTELEKYKALAEQLAHENNKLERSLDRYAKSGLESSDYWQNKYNKLRGVVLEAAEGLAEEDVFYD